jgi:hypothetical protein
MTPKRSSEEPEPLEVFVLKVSFRDHPDIYRVLKMSSESTLVELHEAIQSSIGWANDHPYAFYMSGREGDQETEYYPDHPEADWPAHPGRDAQIVMLCSKALGLSKGSKFLYFFDFGDSHRFDVEVLEIMRSLGDAPVGRPKVLERHGKAPKLY